MEGAGWYGHGEEHKEHSGTAVRKGKEISSYREGGRNGPIQGKKRQLGDVVRKEGTAIGKEGEMDQYKERKGS